MAPTIVAIAGIVALCWFLASARYLLFHSVAELLGIVVAAVIFVIAWNSWRFARNGYLLFLGIASAPIASLDLIHTLAYRGMGVFPGADANLPTQLWIGSRALQALALLLAPLFLGRRPRPWRFAAGGWAVTALVAASIFAGIFPDCYVDGSGLTLFKRMSEYVIVLLMLASIPLLLRRREEFDPRVLRLLVLSIALMAVTDVTFTLYVSVTDLFNRLGHLLKIASVLFLYAAIVETSFRKPYHLLLRNLKTSEDALALAVEQEEAARQAAEDAAGRLRALNEDLRAVNERLAAQSRELRALALDNARLYNDAREANAAKDQLLAVVSHELRNPLSPIVTGVEILSHTLPSDSPAHTTLDIIRRNARLQARLVDDLLDLSRISRGGLPLQQAPVALDEVVEAASRDQRAAAEEAGIDLRVRAAQGGLYVLGDADRLRQVVVNLLTNAIKFTPAGGTIEVRVETDPDTVGTDDGSTPTGATGARKPEGRRFARVVVTDTGAGIGADLLPRIFELFQQGEVAGQRRPGLGLGLSLVKSLVEKQGGRVHAASEGPGKGSRFTVELPLLPPGAAPVRNGSARPASGSRGEPLRVLVVEDNGDTLAMLSEALRRLGHEVHEASSGEQALERLRGDPPDVLLADIGLPGMDGYELLRRVREIPGMADVPAFAVTARGRADDVLQALEAGFVGHFVKPVDLQALHDRLLDCVSSRQPRDPS